MCLAVPQHVGEDHVQAGGRHLAGGAIPVSRVGAGARVIPEGAGFDRRARLGSRVGPDERFPSRLRFLVGAEGIGVQGRKVAAVRLDDPNEMKGVNDRSDLARAERVLNELVVADLMASGVTFRDPATTWVDPSAEIGPETFIEPGVVLRGACQVGEGAYIGANSVLDSAAVGPGEIIPPLTYLTGE